VNFSLSLMLVAVGKAVLDGLARYAHQVMPLGVGKKIQKVCS
jgi:hypothetical protein